MAAPGSGSGTLPRAGRSDQSDCPARPPVAGRSVRAVPAADVSRQDALLDRRARHARPGAGRGHRRGGGVGHPAHPDRHGAPRPAERDGARPQQALRADPGGVQGARRAHVPGRHGVDGGRQVSRGRAARHPWRRATRSRRLDAAQPEPPRGHRSGRRGHGESGRNDRRQRRRAALRPRAQCTDPDSRGRRVPGAGRGRRDAQPEPAAGLQHGRDDPHHRQQPARLHDCRRGFLQHVVRQRPRPWFQDPHRPRERGRPRGLRRGGAPGVCVSRPLPSRFPDRPGRLPALRPQRGRRARLHAAADVSENHGAADRPRALGTHPCRPRRDRAGRRGGELQAVLERTAVGLREAPA